MSRVFLTAEWRNLVMFNYAVDPASLEQFVPRGTVIDSFEGKTYVSLVAFEFNRTRLRGIPIPFHQAFEEVNLRFYVRHNGKRGVVFIRELVPKRAVAAIARVVFNENYSSTPMSHRISGADAEYSWGAGRDQCSMRLNAAGQSFLAAEGSLAQFITEHYWGYAAQKDGGCLEYEVRHEPWRVFESKTARFTGNAAFWYGDEFARVLAADPASAFLAIGSAVTVFEGTRIV